MGNIGNGPGPTPGVAAAAPDDLVSRLCRLALLRDCEALSEEEFQTARATLVADWELRAPRSTSWPLALADDRSA
jgi:hypothetical protein